MSEAPSSIPIASGSNMSSLPAVWAYILPALDQIMRADPEKLEPPPLDVNYHMGVYTVIYNFATASKPDGTHGTGINPSSSGASGLGSMYGDALSSFASPWARELAGFRGLQHSNRPNKPRAAIEDRHTHRSDDRHYHHSTALTTTDNNNNGSNSSSLTPSALNALAVASHQDWFEERMERVRAMVGYELYVRLEEYFRAVARDIRNAAPADDAALLSYYLHAHIRFSNGVAVINGLFSYLNRHFITRAAGEGIGWVSLQDVYKDRRPPPPSSSNASSSNNASAHQTKKAKNDAELIETKKKELLKQHWNFVGGTSEQRRAAEACAEAGSPPERIVPIASLAHRCWRLEVVEPFLSAGLPKNETANGTDHIPVSTSANGGHSPITPSASIHLTPQTPTTNGHHLTIPTSSSASTPTTTSPVSKTAKKNKKKKEKAREKGKQREGDLSTSAPDLRELSLEDRDENDREPPPSISTSSTRPASPLTSSSSFTIPVPTLPTVPPPDPRGRLNRVVGDLVLTAPRHPSINDAKSSATKLSKSLRVCGVRPDNIVRRRLDKFLKG